PGGDRWRQSRRAKDRPADNVLKRSGRRDRAQSSRAGEATCDGAAHSPWSGRCAGTRWASAVPLFPRAFWPCFFAAGRVFKVVRLRSGSRRRLGRTFSTAAARRRKPGRIRLFLAGRGSVSCSAEIVEAHNGTLSLENREDRPGWVVRLELPRS